MDLQDLELGQAAQLLNVANFWDFVVVQRKESGFWCVAEFTQIFALESE